jgi:RNA polymerase sigma factor (TIGR02999 family)
LLILIEQGAQPMSDVTQILGQIEAGDGQAAEKLLPLVYDELRKLVAARMAKEDPGQTLQPTALVHEAYIRLVDVDKAQHWNSRGHFFAAAAEAMRRILVERARHKHGIKRGGDRQQQGGADVELLPDQRPDRILEVDAALNDLAAQDPRAAELVKLRFFVGFTTEEAAAALGLSARSAERIWVYAKAWFRETLGK